MNRLIRSSALALVATLALSVPGRAADKDIVDTAVAAGSFKTLAAALKAAGLVDTLKGAGPFTVFAPTDEAFAKLPAGTVETLLKPENKAKLTAILTYHVVPGNGHGRRRREDEVGEDGAGRARSRSADERQGHDRQGDRDQGRHRGEQRRHPRHRHRADA